MDRDRRSGMFSWFTRFRANRCFCIYQRSVLLACFFSLLGLIALVERRHWLAVLFFFLLLRGRNPQLRCP